MAQQLPHRGQVVQEECGAGAEEVDGDVGVGEVALGAEDPAVARGVTLDREQAVQHDDAHRLWGDGG